MPSNSFLLRNLHHTEQRSGVLIFVSVAEHYVEILADKGINDLVENTTWQDIVQVFVQQVRQAKVAQGFIGCIESCGRLLAEKFPSQGDGRGENKNELPDRLVQL